MKGEPNGELAPVVILGAGGHARVVAEALQPRPVAGYLTPHEGVGPAAAVLGPRLGDDTAVGELAATGHHVAVGLGFVDRAGAASRSRLLEQLDGVQLVTVRHPQVIVSPSVVVGAGSFIGPGAVVGTGAELGRAAVVNSGAVVDHDCRIGDNVHVASGAVLSGGVSVGDHTLVGAGATVRQGVQIGSSVVVGAGAVVIDDLADGVTAVGVPARVIAQR